MTSLLVWCASHLQGGSFQVLLTKFLTSTCTFPFQRMSSHCVVGRQVVQPCTCKEYIHAILDYFPTSQSKHYNLMMASICTDQYCSRPSAYARARTMGRAMLGFQVLSKYIYIYIYSLSRAPLLATQCLLFVKSVLQYCLFVDI